MKENLKSKQKTVNHKNQKKQINKSQKERRKK